MTDDNRIDESWIARTSPEAQTYFDRLLKLSRPLLDSREVEASERQLGATLGDPPGPDSAIR